MPYLIGVLLSFCLLFSPHSLFAEKLQYSKEYQAKFDPKLFSFLPEGKQYVIALLQKLEDNPHLHFKFKTNSGEEQILQSVIRYDTPDQKLTKNNIVLRVDHYQKKGRVHSKIKLKYNCFDPDVCLPKGDREALFLSPQKGQKNRKIKMELDIHSNFAKYALSGTVKVPGAVRFKTVQDTTPYFKELHSLVDVELSSTLASGTEYYEWNWSDIELKIRGKEILGTLTVRYENRNFQSPIKVEFSMRVKKKKKWNNKLLKEMGRVFHEIVSDQGVLRTTINPSKAYYLPAKLESKAAPQ